MSTASFAAWDTLCSRMAELGETPTPLCELVASTKFTRVVCGVVVTVISFNAAQDTLLRLQDSTGTMLCCLHGEVIEEFACVLVPGSAMILRNVAVVASPEGPCLIVCRHNVVSLFESPQQHRPGSMHPNNIYVSASLDDAGHSKPLQHPSQSLRLLAESSRPPRAAPIMQQATLSTPSLHRETPRVIPPVKKLHRADLVAVVVPEDDDDVTL